MDLGKQIIKQRLSNRFHRMLIRPDVSGCFIKKIYMMKMFEINLNRLSLLQNLSNFDTLCAL